MAAGLFVALAPMPARAVDQIKVLEAQVAALQSQVNTQQGQITTLQNQLTMAKSVLALAPFVSVDLNPEIGVIGPHITFKGANIHIISGMGTTNDNGNPSGLGNLIIGYDEDPTMFGQPFNAGDRGGSHNLIIGGGNRFTKLAFGGLVAGEGNTVSAEATTVSGGSFNTASNSQANVSGGRDNTASGFNASVTGGVNNVAGGIETVVIGGNGVIDNNNRSIAPQPPFP
jgi:hypothetical protein